MKTEEKNEKTAKKNEPGAGSPAGPLVPARPASAGPRAAVATAAATYVETMDAHDRRSSPRKRPEGEPLDVEPAAPAEEPVAACRCAVRLLAELRTGHAEVLRAVDFDGEEPAAVAARLGLTRGNLDVRLHRARRELREKVMRHCGVDGAAPCLDCTCDASSCCGGAADVAFVGPRRRSTAPTTSRGRWATSRRA